MLGQFLIHQPTTVAEAASMLRDYAGEATLYAGGTELLPLMKDRLTHYPHLVDLKTIPQLDLIEVVDGGRSLRVGALASHRQVERSALVRQHLPLLAEVEAHIANVRVRAAGTIGGNLAFGESHSDLAPLLIAWGATLELVSWRGRRELPIDGFFTGILQTTRALDEVLTAVTIPLAAATASSSYERFRMHQRASAGVAVRLQLNAGVVAAARVVIGSVGPFPARVAGAEQALQGERPTPQLLARAAELAAGAADPIADLYGSVDYKRHLVRVLTTRALEMTTREEHQA